MKNLKKILCLLLVFTLVAVCFVGCKNDEPAGETETKKEDTETNDKESVEELMDNYFEVLSSEFSDGVKWSKELQEFAAPDGDLYEECEEAMASYEEEIQNIATLFGDEKATTEFVNKFSSIKASAASYEITEIKVNDDEATVTYNVTAPDESALEDEYMTIMFSVANDYLMETQGVTFEEYLAYLETFITTEEEATAAVATIFQACLDEIYEELEALLKDESKYSTKQKTAELVKVDDEWLIEKIK